MRMYFMHKRLAAVLLHCTHNAFVFAKIFIPNKSCELGKSHFSYKYLLVTCKLTCAFTYTGVGDKVCWPLHLSSTHCSGRTGRTPKPENSILRMASMPLVGWRLSRWPISGPDQGPVHKQSQTLSKWVWRPIQPIKLKLFDLGLS